MIHEKKDKVKIKSLEWFNNAPKDEDGDILISEKPHVWFTVEMKEYCGKEAIIEKIYDDGYFLDITKEEYMWTDDMFEPIE